MSDHVTYSMAQLWNMSALDLTDQVIAGATEPVPVSGDAHQRQALVHRGRSWMVQKAWADMKEAVGDTEAAQDVETYTISERKGYRDHLQAEAIAMETPC